MAFGDGFGSGIATCVSDLFAAQGELKAQGEAFEQQSSPARSTRVQTERFTEMLTAIKTNQASRDLFLSLGTTEANVAGTGLAESGSVLDILRTSAGCADQSRHRRARSDH
jgi:hypothetical protein